MSERRETSDRLLCKLIQQRKVPTLGVGVGMQELNVVYGGGLSPPSRRHAQVHPSL